MQPKFKTRKAWNQAEMLLQPAFIRVVDNFRAQLEDSPWTGEYEDIQDPYPGYVLRLKKDHIETTVNIWDLCYQICFVAYPTGALVENGCTVEIDETLFEASGAVDWQKLEAKTQQLIHNMFEQFDHLGG
ncbi:hypothetical protein [Picosynechococcus sp. PCC 73109]|uniref:hypothetical protein n=1 Tax=Picosynechococcus sp. PCC 73109 TaxID=374982 RepID=UPI0007459145|nr:hypothetical protein [Picosynechococcus sp. PCC 73109]AMA08216.1 hypothetical protein AWQ23_02175 [Picosynechococcus sp. PCC 73109]